MSESDGDVLRANTIGPAQVHVGMNVTGVDGEVIGKVKEIGQTEFLIDRPLARDVWVPYEAVMAAEGHGDGFRAGPPRAEEVVLNVSAAHVEAQHWRHA